MTIIRALYANLSLIMSRADKDLVLNLHPRKAENRHRWTDIFSVKDSEIKGNVTLSVAMNEPDPRYA